MTLPPVLLYHAVCSAPEGASDPERRLFVNPDRFSDQMDDLSRRGYRTLALEEYAAVLGGRARLPKSVLLTFDDAYAHVDEVVTPVLRRHGFRGVMFAPFGHLGGRNTWDAARFPSLAHLEIATAGQIRNLDPCAWDVASHGLWHVDLRSVDPRFRRTELVRAREGLSELLGWPVLDLAYPHGGTDAAVRWDAQHAGYRMAFTAGYDGGRHRFQLSRWPIGAEDSLAVFRLKSSDWSFPLYRAYDLAPRWARTMAKVVVQAAHVRMRVH